jgi:hypothetical protein
VTLPITATSLNQSARPAIPTPAHAENWVNYTVARGDSIYGIAGRLADGDLGRTREIAQEILDRNLGHVMNDGQRFTSPGVIQIGWLLDIPADGVATVAALSSVDAAPPVDETHTVSGDSHWEIADHHRIVLGASQPPQARRNPRPHGRCRAPWRPNAELNDLPETC